jgi:hypothetical protein
MLAGFLEPDDEGETVIDLTGQPSRACQEAMLRA